MSVAAKFDTKDLMKILNNSVKYSEGFFEGVNASKVQFNRRLADYTIESLYEYIDAKARMNPEALHHVYEWNSVGSPSGRLFELKGTASAKGIKITGNFLDSSSVSDTSNQPFVDKAYVMESGISIEIEPKKSDFLAFEDNGEMVFTRNSIIIDHPGGDEVAGSFGAAVDDFFETYFSNTMLYPLIEKLRTVSEFAQFFASGAKSGKSVGVSAGKKYLSFNGVDL